MMPRLARKLQASRKGDALKLGLLAVLCLGIVGVTAIHLAAQGADLRTEKDWDAVSGSRDPKRLAAITERARHTLYNAPLDVRAISLLAMAKEAGGDRQTAEKLMRVASTLSRRDSASNLWLFINGVKNRQYDQAFASIDAYMRRSPAAADKVLANVVAAAVQPGAAPALAKRLALQPSWRGGFYSALARMSPNHPDIAFTIMSETLKAGSPPTREELQLHLNRMVAAQRYEEAYLQWILLLPTEQTAKLGYLNDGEFENDGGYPPFGWTLRGIEGATVEIASAYGRQGKALRVGYDGFSSRPMPTQLLLLPPGAYKMTGDYLAEDADSFGRMKWMVACAGDDAQPLAEHLVGDTKGGWRRFVLNFTVPATGCTAQVAGAAPVVGVRRVPVGVWFDKITLVQAGASS